MAVPDAENVTSLLEGTAIGLAGLSAPAVLAFRVKAPAEETVNAVARNRPTRILGLPVAL
jgi:hypothetical protein